MHIVEAILFSPRGGSAHLTRALTARLRAQGLRVDLLSGSRSDLEDGLGDARAFYGAQVHAVDFTAALATGEAMDFAGGPGQAPMHPSFEDRAGAADVAFPRLDDERYERQVAAWARALAAAGAAEADVLLLHHLTPMAEAARRVAPEVPVVCQLHGTELLMLEQIAAGAPAEWRHAERWALRLRAWAAQSDRLLVAPGGRARAAALLGLPGEAMLEAGGGVDPAVFHPCQVDRGELWRELGLGAAPEGCVLVFCGRFTAVKRLDRLVPAFARAREAAGQPAALLLVGGHPGELEGEHPLELARRLGIEGVFHVPWRSQEALPRLLCAGDVIVLASERESFGQVLVEGMACGLPAVATRSDGPEAIVQDGVTGWLAANEEAALEAALVEAIRSPAERRRRGAAAREAALRRFTWEAVAGRVREALEEVAGRAREE